MRPLVRPALLLAAVAAPLLASGTAAAQDGGVSTFGSADFFIGVQRVAGANLSDFDIARFFNKARCDCDEEVFIYAALTNSGFAKRTSVDRTGNIEFWVGSDCGNISFRSNRCMQLSAPTLAAFLNEGRNTMPTTARVMSTYTLSTTVDGGTTATEPFPVKGNPTCTAPVDSFSQTIFVIINSKEGQPQVISSRAVTINLLPPPPPGVTEADVQGGNQALTISWQGVDSAVITDMLGYQVLCKRGESLQVFDTGTFEPGYSVCPGTITAANPIERLDPLYTCSPLLAPTARSFRIKVLQNDIWYGAAVVSIDRSGNPSFADTFYKKPIKTKSFYDVYREGDVNQAGAADGGLCTLGAGTRGRGAAAASLGAALALAAIVVARRRRRRP